MNWATILKNVRESADEATVQWVELRLTDLGLVPPAADDCMNEGWKDASAQDGALVGAACGEALEIEDDGRRLWAVQVALVWKDWRRQSQAAQSKAYRNAEAAVRAAFPPRTHLTFSLRTVKDQAWIDREGRGQPMPYRFGSLVQPLPRTGGGACASCGRRRCPSVCSRGHRLRGKEDRCGQVRCGPCGVLATPRCSR